MSFSMSISSTIAAPPRSFLSAHTASLPRSYSSLNPTAKPRASAQPLVDIRTHISNLDRILQKNDDASHEAASAFNLPTNTASNRKENVSGNRIFDVLKLHGLFNRSSSADEISPRSLRKLQRLLSSPRPSPRNTIAGDWRRYHGAENWAGLLDPLDENLRRELVRYGDLVQAAYQSFYSPSSPLPDRSYRVTRILHATSSVAFLPGSLPRSSPIGYVAVCENEREVRRMGRRDIVIALRGTATCLEWVENLRAGLVPVDDDEAKVECGFLSLYKTSGDRIPSLSMSVVEEVRRLMEIYQGEELSITVTGHSLGAALAVLVADELSVAGAPPVAVFSFGGPRVGNRAFADRVGRRGVKVLRVVNAHDVVTRVPARVDEGWAARVLEGYADVGEELRVDSRVSPYLRPNADPACCHDLEAYLHLVDGFNGTCRPFRSDANRSLARLMTQQGGNVKNLYTVHARALAVDPAYAFRSNGPACLASPSS